MMFNEYLHILKHLLILQLFIEMITFLDDAIGEKVNEMRF